MRTYVQGALITLAVLGSLSLFVIWRHQNSPDAQVARSVVEHSYQCAANGNLAELALVRWKWQDVQDRYGRVVAFRIVRQRWAATDFAFEVDVQRERAHTREIATASAGKSKADGYYISPSASDITVSEAHSIGARPR